MPRTTNEPKRNDGFMLADIDREIIEEGRGYFRSNGEISRSEALRQILRDWRKFRSQELANYRRIS